MRIFETWPPSSAIISACAALLILFLGLEFAFTFLAGVTAMRLGFRVDHYGAPPTTSERTLDRH